MLSDNTLEKIDRTLLSAKLNLLGIETPYFKSGCFVWLIPCTMNKKGLAYNSTLSLTPNSLYIKYKQTHYSVNDLDELFKRIAFDMARK